MLSYTKLQERYKEVMKERSILNSTIRQLKMERDSFKYLLDESKKDNKQQEKKIKEQEIVIDMLYQQIYKG